ncbi:uncharacterized protein [Physcomitrium patens]|uniref:uncharacterized protein n=1 Tax=Physcomitrium patens TaxID=3218 RepID=UPI003CCD5034
MSSENCSSDFLLILRTPNLFSVFIHIAILQLLCSSLDIKFTRPACEGEANVARYEGIQHNGSYTAQTLRYSPRLDRTCTPRWSSSTETRNEIRNDPKGTQLGRARAVTLAVDNSLKGNLKLLHANPKISAQLERVYCECRLRGSRTCTINCPCSTKWKSCGIECECHGFCCNSFFYTPRLSIRLGEELYTKTDLSRYRIAFVICGRIMTVPEYWRYHEKMIHRAVRHYGFSVSWPGFAHGLPRNPDLDKYAVDPFEDMTGAVNHSCEPNIIVEACWVNGKLYAVGRAIRNIMAKEALTVDYNVSLLQEQHAITEKALQQLYEDLAAAELAGANSVELEMRVIRKEIENGKLKANIELMITAVARLRASLSEATTANDGKVSEVMKSLCSSLAKFVRRIRTLFSCKSKGVDEELAKGTIESCESCETSSVLMPSARSENTSNFDTPQSQSDPPPASTVPQVCLGMGGISTRGLEILLSNREFAPRNYVAPKHTSYRSS